MKKLLILLSIFSLLNIVNIKPAGRYADTPSSAVTAEAPAKESKEEKESKELKEKSDLRGKICAYRLTDKLDSCDLYLKTFPLFLYL